MARATGILLYVKDQSGGFDLQVRMFAPLYGVPEDILDVVFALRGLNRAGVQSLLAET